MQFLENKIEVSCLKFQLPILNQSLALWVKFKKKNYAVHQVDKFNEKFISFQLTRWLSFYSGKTKSPTVRTTVQIQNPKIQIISIEVLHFTSNHNHISISLTQAIKWTSNLVLLITLYYKLSNWYMCQSYFKRK